MDEKEAQLRKHLDVLRQAYVDQIPDRRAEIEGLAAALDGPLSKKETLSTVETLRQRAHKLAGSGATFGFARIGDAARKLERRCDSILQGASTLSDEERAEYAWLVGVLIRAFEDAVVNGTDTNDPERTGIPGDPPDSLPVIVIEADCDQARRVEIELTNMGFAVRILSDSQDLPAAVRHTPPAVVILDGDVPADVKSVTRMREDGIISCPVCFVASSGDIHARLAAVRSGCNEYLLKPLNFNDLLNALDRVAGANAQTPYRILIVDDDVSLAAYTKAVLESAGMFAETVTEPMKVLERLDDFGPELILMDLYMPECNGRELAAVIRQQEACAGIPIVFLSGEADVEKQLGAMVQGGDDFLTKPYKPEFLIASVRARVQRFHLLRKLMVRDSMTGLFNHTVTKQLLENELARAHREEKPLTLAVFDIDHFKSVNDTHGHGVGDRVIKSLSRLLKQRLRGSDIIGRMGGEEFAAVLAGIDAKGAREILDRVRLDFSKIAHHGADGDFFVTLSCGLADCPAFDTVASLFDAADKALYAAKGSGRNRVVLAD